MHKYTKFILNRDDVITIIALLASLKDEVEHIKDHKIKDRALGFIYENFDANDVKIFNNIDYIMDNTKYLEFENLE